MPKKAARTAIADLPAIAQEYDPAVAVESLRPHPENPREGDVGAISASIEANGFYGAVVAQRSTRRILAGNHRVEAAQGLGKPTVPVVWVDVDDRTARRILLADNKTADEASYNTADLATLLQGVMAEAGDLEGTGFEPADVDELMAQLKGHRTTAEAADDAEVAPAPATPTTRTGDRITLGSHILVCGDARDPATVARAMGGHLADCMWTDPPYGVEYEGKTKRKLTIANDGADGLAALLRDAFASVTTVMADGCRFYIATPPGPKGTEFRLAVSAAGWTLHQSLAWVKQTMVLGHSDYHYRHEDLLYGWKPGPGRIGRGNHPGSQWYGDHSQTSVLEFDRPQRSEHHPTMKPVALIAYCLGNSSREGAHILDPFSGSGSTLMACEATQRTAHCVEIDPGYCDVIVTRWQEASGLEAVREVASPPAGASKPTHATRQKHPPGRPGTSRRRHKPHE